MDTAVISAFSALAGSLFGGSASIATTWLTQHGTDRRKRLTSELSRRESLYGNFINECSKLLIDALDHSLDKPEVMVQAYCLFNRIRLVSSPPVLAAAQVVVRSLVEAYFRKNLSMDEIKELVLRGEGSVTNALADFSLACRAELEALHRGE